MPGAFYTFLKNAVTISPFPLQCVSMYFCGLLYRVF